MSVFTSRWKALWWSAGVLLTAYCSVPSAEESAQSDAEKTQSEQAAKQAVDAINGLNNSRSTHNQD
ncbi:MAG: hypothetical protein ABIM50_06085 [Novosphingobium sp.]